MSVTCKPCGARWTGLRMEHCTVCHRTFSGSSTGDQHRPVGGPCLTDEQMHEKGFRLTDEKSHMWRKAPAENSPWSRT